MYKIAVIGAGVVGAMTARRLSAYKGDIIIIEKEQDVAMGQSKANSGIVHAGFDPLPGSLKAKMNVRGSKMMEETCRLLGVGYRRNGSLVAAFSDEDCLMVERLYDRGVENGVDGLRILSGEEIFRVEKNLSRKIKKALYAPTGAVVCPYELTIEAVGCAMDNGAELVRSFEVADISQEEDHYVITADDGRSIRSRFVINCAGLYSDKIARMVGDDSFNIVPRAGEYLLLDKEASYLTDTTIFKVPDQMGKGVLAVRTVDGNILLGPTSADRTDKEDVSVTGRGIENIKEKEAMFFDDIPYDKVITQFAGLRAHGDRGDFIINSPKPGFINAAAIESPGLTSAPAIAIKIEEILAEQGADLIPKHDYSPGRPERKVFSKCTIEEKNALIQQDAAYGHVVCRCEEVTEAEIKEAIRRAPSAMDVDGVKRRTRSGMGRCQGGFCMPQVVEILARELGIQPEEVTKNGKYSNILTGKVKGGKCDDLR